MRAFRGRTQQLIMCSTIDVYSKPAPAYPVGEGWSRSPTYAYGLDKARSEDVLMRAHEQGDFAVTILRPGATYDETGPCHQQPGDLGSPLCPHQGGQAGGGAWRRELAVGLVPRR